MHTICPKSCDCSWLPHHHISPSKSGRRATSLNGALRWLYWLHGAVAGHWLWLLWYHHRSDPVWNLVRRDDIHQLLYIHNNFVTHLCLDPYYYSIKHYIWMTDIHATIQITSHTGMRRVDINLPYHIGRVQTFYQKVYPFVKISMICKASNNPHIRLLPYMDSTLCLCCSHANCTAPCST